MSLVRRENLKAGILAAFVVAGALCAGLAGVTSQADAASKVKLTAMPSKGEVRVFVKKPIGTPATITLKGRVSRVLTPNLARQKTVFKLRMPSGKVKVKAPAATFGGKVYRAQITPRGRFRLRPGRAVRVRVVYRKVLTVEHLEASSIKLRSISLRWNSKSIRRVALRRTIGDVAPKSIKSGKAVKTTKGRAMDAGLEPGTTYSYSLFSWKKSKRGKGRWLGPLSVTARTVSLDPSIASYVAPPSTVIVKPGDPEVAVVDGSKLTVRLGRGRPTPLVGSGFVMPISRVLPLGFLGVVQSVSANGRTVVLAPGGFADAFDYYSIDVNFQGEEVELRPASSRESDGRRIAAATLPSCLGGSIGGSVNLRPSLEPFGHFNTELETFLGIPHRLDFDLEGGLAFQFAADLSVAGAVTCGLPFQKIIHLISPSLVPISLVFDPSANVGISGKVNAENVGLGGRFGFQVGGSFGTSMSVDGDLITELTPLDVDYNGSATAEITLGGELTVGPGGGVDTIMPELDAGAIAGVGGEILPLSVKLGPHFGDDDLRHTTCIVGTVGGEAELNVNAKAWLGSLSASESFTIDALRRSWDYADPFYFPSDCQNQPPIGPTGPTSPTGPTGPTGPTAFEDATWQEAGALAIPPEVAPNSISVPEGVVGVPSAIYSMCGDPSCNFANQTACLVRYGHDSAQCLAAQQAYLLSSMASFDGEQWDLLGGAGQLYSSFPFGTRAVLKDGTIAYQTGNTHEASWLEPLGDGTAWVYAHAYRYRVSSQGQEQTQYLGGSFANRNGTCSSDTRSVAVRFEQPENELRFAAYFSPSDQAQPATWTRFASEEEKFRPPGGILCAGYPGGVLIAVHRARERVPGGEWDSEFRIYKLEDGASTPVEIGSFVGGPRLEEWRGVNFLAYEDPSDSDNEPTFWLLVERTVGPGSSEILAVRSRNGVEWSAPVVVSHQSALAGLPFGVLLDERLFRISAADGYRVSTLKTD